MALLVYLLLFLALVSGRSYASYCICKDGLGDQALQKTIDYACGAGADCAQILQNGACFNPNTVKDHCSYAANSYYQRKVSSGATCDFSGTATLSNSPPANAPANCYQSGPSSGTPTTNPTTPIGTPGTITPPSGINTPAGTPSTNNGGAGGFNPGAGGTGGGVLGPSSTGGLGDNSGAAPSFTGMNLSFFASMAILFSSPFLLWA